MDWVIAKGVKMVFTMRSTSRSADRYIECHGRGVRSRALVRSHASVDTSFSKSPRLLRGAGVLARTQWAADSELGSQSQKSGDPQW